MQANPKKCITMGMKKFDPRYVPNIDYERYGDTVYCPYDPNLTIGGEKLKFIVNAAADPDSLQFDHFKELGRFISVNLKEDKMETEICRRLEKDMNTVDACGVNGLCKLFLYEHFVVRRLSWVFMVHDLSLSFSQELDRKTIPRLKSWAGLYRGTEVGALFRSREHLGLQLTSIEERYQHLQVVKCCLLQSSQDECIRTLYAQRKEKVCEFTARWSGPKELAQLEPVADHALRFAGQTNRAGLGANKKNPYIANPSVVERRDKITSTLAAQREEEHMRHAACLVRQGVWTHWDNVLPFDLSWPNLIYGPGPRVIAFVLNAQINSMRTPDMLKLWGYISDSTCSLCNASACTLHHLLVNCKFALDQGRYTWRHDSVLLDIEQALLKLVRNFNGKKPACFADVARKEYQMSFVKAGERNTSPLRARDRSMLFLSTRMTGKCRWISKIASWFSLQ